MIRRPPRSTRNRCRRQRQMCIRDRDIAECYADPTKAENELGWKAEYGLKEMCEDSWRWQENNPNGYNQK